jgi:hypothetical protein
MPPWRATAGKASLITAAPAKAASPPLTALTAGGAARVSSDRSPRKYQVSRLVQATSSNRGLWLTVGI